MVERMHLAMVLTLALMRSPFALSVLLIPEVIAAVLVMRIDGGDADSVASDPDVCAVRDAIWRIVARITKEADRG